MAKFQLSVMSAGFTAWVMNGGYTTIYYNFAEYGYIWALLEWPVVFIAQVGSEINWGEGAGCGRWELWKMLTIVPVAVFNLVPFESL